jgi:competence protein ComFC
MRAVAKRDPLRALSSLFYPPLCVVCSSNVDEREYLCEGCRSRAPRIISPFCAKCSEPFSGAITQTFSCANCAHRILHFDVAVAAYRSRGLVRTLVHEFKYGRQRHLRYPLAAWLGETMIDPRLRGRRFDLIVPVPLHSARERERGFNQQRFWRNCSVAGLRCRFAMSSSGFDIRLRKPPMIAPNGWKICTMPFVYEKR